MMQRELSYYEEQVAEICKELNADKRKKRKAITLADVDKDKLFTAMLNRIDEEDRWNLLLYCAKRGFIALR